MPLALALVGAAAVVVGFRLARDTRPNIVVVLVDTLRRDHVGAYGYPRPTTPFLDSLAADGVVFDAAWSHAPQTLNSTTTIFTSTLFPELRLRFVPGRTEGERDLPVVSGIAEDNLTFAEVLAEHGYETVAVFTNPHHHEGSSFAQGFARWRFLPQPSEERPYASAAEVNEVFRELVRDTDPERPLLAYLHYMDVHQPYQPPPELEQQFVTVRGRVRYMNGRPVGDAVPTEDDVRFMRDRYDASIRYVDDCLRDLFAMLAQRRERRPTVLLVLSDHGEEFMEHGGLGHGHSAYPELLRIPMILHGAPFPPGTRVERLVRGIDVAPTLVELAGAELPESFEGRSLVPFIEAASAGEERAPRRFRDDPEGLSFAWHGHLRGLTFGPLHLAIDFETEERALFTVQGDQRLPDGERSAVVKARWLEGRWEPFETRLRQAHRLSVARSRKAPPPPLAPHTAAQLRALGYVD